MQIEVDMSEVDPDVVAALLLAMADAVLDAAVDPTTEEMIVAIGEMMKAIMEEAGFSEGTLH